MTIDQMTIDESMATHQRGKELWLTALLVLALAVLVSIIGWDRFSTYFEWQPFHIWEIALVFGMASKALAVGRRFRPQAKWVPCCILCLVWLLYSAWEWYATAMRWDIRVDLLLGWPPLFAGTLWGIAISIRSLGGPGGSELAQDAA